MKALLSIVFVVTSAVMCIGSEGSTTTWYVGERMYEGFPLMLRFPEKPDFDGLEKRYTRFVTIVHHLAKVEANGLPERDYNKALFDFDQYVLGMFGNDGFPVLVETFGGKRSYYIYITPETDVGKAQQDLEQRYSEERTSWQVGDGNGWKFIRRYSEEYEFYKKG